MLCEFCEISKNIFLKNSSEKLLQKTFKIKKVMCLCSFMIRNVSSCNLLRLWNSRKNLLTFNFAWAFQQVYSSLTFPYSNSIIWALEKGSIVNFEQVNVTWVGCFKTSGWKSVFQEYFAWKILLSAQFFFWRICKYMNVEWHFT